MQYNEALDYIHGTLKFGIKLGLHNMEALLELMGNPHHKLKYVHVAGTNGKGSTVAFISSILMEAGYKTGIYTSPFLERFTERIKINSEEIQQDELGRITQFVKEKVDIMVAKGENHPTEFEIVTAIAFQYFYESNCDIVVLEVGLGGRFDSTNIISTPLAAVITTISYDHMDILGSTLPQIAFEKGGIIKEKGDVVLYPQAVEVEQVFTEICTIKQARMHQVDFTRLDLSDFSADGQTFDFEGYKFLSISLLGDHQVRNAAVAIKALDILKDKGFDISENAVRGGLLKARWPGRLEIISKNPMLLIDGAHNIEGAKSLYNALTKYFPNNKKIFIIGVLRDKDYKAIIETMAPIAHQFITITPKNNRALLASELALFIKPYCNNVIANDTIKSAIDAALSIYSPGDVICAFGSLYYIGEIRKIFEQ